MKLPEFSHSRLGGDEERYLLQVLKAQPLLRNCQVLLDSRPMYPIKIHSKWWCPSWACSPSWRSEVRRSIGTGGTCPLGVFLFDSSKWLWRTGLGTCFILEAIVQRDAFMEQNHPQWKWNQLGEGERTRRVPELPYSLLLNRNTIKRQWFH